ncbi:hypothetical protein GYMLUDRAFT_42499 [Collybiopsis luxurians FD-317 M1]|uniref:Sensitive to high expression protein 9, mitochondrial n=1 Tax=Collybiopsis luxurians FD-317 M1 TaxID=944289 RepID=A0A0D0CZP1_9AGAR|nr:hypothetical protein GYMLUDRAFT_42499 [Collybiopsis luxurians FD-317 M1]
MLRLNLRTPLVRSQPLHFRRFHPSAVAWNVPPESPPSAWKKQQSESSASTSTHSPEPIDTSSPDSPSPSTSTTPPASSSSSEPKALPNELQKKPIEEFRALLSKYGQDCVFQFRRRADDFTSSTKARLSGLGAELNKVTGYEQIEALKQQVVAQEARIEQTRQAARAAKINHEDAVLRRSKSQREVNDLLQRKSSWSDEDVIRFTSLVREDHLLEQEETRSKLAADEAESAVETEFTELMHSILARYHEEQVWSDKIRSASTYGQLAALGLNLAVFILAIILVEPWKRKRLAQTFEKKVEELNEQYKGILGENMQVLQKQLEDQAVIIAALTAAVTKIDAQTQHTVEDVVSEGEPVSSSDSTWTKTVKDRNFGEAVAMGALAASVLSALGWIWLGG